MHLIRPSQRIVSITLRLIIAVPVGYLVVADVVTIFSLLLSVLMGMSRAESVVLAAMCGFLLYLGWLMMSFSVRSLARLSVTTLSSLLLTTLFLRLMML